MDIDVELVRRLVAVQFPEWANLSISPVPRQGNDNRTFRLGENLAVRLPSDEGYVAAISKEDRFLPHLAEHLPLAIPVPMATGRPTPEFERPWSVRSWLAGDTADRDADLDRRRFAHDLGAALRELHAAPVPDGGPVAGVHSFYRGCHPSVYGDQVQAALIQLADETDVAACEAIWRDALRSAWSAAPAWFHGDVDVGNLLTHEGRLAALIDFGTCGVGDPACDLVIAWTFFDDDERAIFREAVGLPADAWARARGWALWKALITLAHGDGDHRDRQGRALARLLDEA